MNPEVQSPDLETHTLLIRLEHFFTMTSKFRVRWKSGLLKDLIASGVYQQEFFDEFSKRDFKLASRQQWVQTSTFTNEQGERRACVLFVARELPQVHPVKKRYERWRLFRERHIREEEVAEKILGAVFVLWCIAKIASCVHPA
jgi:hypothetical protein